MSLTQTLPTRLWKRHTGRHAPWLTVAVLIVVLDQASKSWIMAFLTACPTCGSDITPFFNLVLVANRGLGFGLFASWGAWGGSFFFPTLLAILVGVLIVWIVRTPVPIMRLCLGTIVGGAIGNLIDRVRLGFVVDFLDLHAGDWHWPAFNVADVAVVGGVAGYMVWDVFLKSRDSSPPDSAPRPPPSS